jgi:hypothetical protein
MVKLYAYGNSFPWIKQSPLLSVAQAGNGASRVIYYNHVTIKVGIHV